MVGLSEVNKQLDPRDFSYRLNAIVRKLISKCLSVPDGKDDNGLDVVRDKLQKVMDKEEGDKQMVSYDDLSEIHKCLQILDPSYDLFFYQLLEETNVIVPKSNKKPELQERLTRLKCEAAAKEYQKMTDGVHLVPANSKNKVKSAAVEIKEVKSLMAALINGTMVVFCSFLFIYKAVEYSLPKQNIPTQILTALAGSIIIAIAELYFFIRVM